MTPAPAIETYDLRKEFGDQVAVADLTLTVERGEVFGFLGPNGAGKTTSVKMLLGLVHPTAGSARLLGHPIADFRARARVGFLPEHFRFHEWQTGAEFLAFHAELHGMARGEARRRTGDLLDLVGLAQERARRLRHYSKGMLQRIGLAQALLHDPEVVFLDEPTSGLDPGGRRLVREILRDLARRGTTVFLNSHLLSEIERICDRVAFVRQGIVLRMGTLASFADGTLEVEVRAHGLTDEAVRGLARWASDIRREDGTLRFRTAGEATLPAIHRHLVAEGADLISFRPDTPSLEDVFLRIVGAAGDAPPGATE